MKWRLESLLGELVRTFSFSCVMASVLVAEVEINVETVIGPKEFDFNVKEPSEVKK